MDEIEERLARYRQSSKNSQEDRQDVQVLKTPPSQSTVKTQNKIIENSLKRHNAQLLEEDEEGSEFDALWKKEDILKLCLMVALYFILFALFIILEFGIVYFLVSSILIMYFNTGDRKKRRGLSAYSVFNPNMERIHGTVTAEQLQNNMLGRFS